jgi:hypothetical protein
MITYWHTVATLALKLRRWQQQREQQRAQKQRQQWLNTHINHRAHTVRACYAYYRHVIPVDYRATHIPDFMTWVLASELRDMSWPARSSEDAIMVVGRRVVQIDNDWRIDDWAGYDQAFVMTNNDQEAMWIALKYSQ